MPARPRTERTRVLWSFVAFGVGFGLFFPVAATYLRYQPGLSLLALHGSDKLLLIIDTAPFFLGVFSLAIGLRQARLLELTEAFVEEERAKGLHLARLASLGEVTGGIAHELNNPLAVIHAMLHRNLSVFEEELDPEKLAKLKVSHERMLAQVGRIEKIISGLKAFSRPGNAKEKESVRFRVIMASVTDLCTEISRRRGVPIQVSGEEVLLHCNRVQMEQVLVNLVSNAVDAVGALPERWIKVVCAESRGGVEISVTDSGRGIPPEVAAKLMQPYFTTKPPGKGTGLGLSISKTIVENHGGRLYLDGACPNTRFVLSIPAHENQSVSA